MNFFSAVVLADGCGKAARHHHLGEPGSLQEHSVPVPNSDLWSVRADRTEHVTSLSAV